MSEANDGGPAFPRSKTATSDGGIVDTGEAGMSLRDWFAGQVVAGKAAAGVGINPKYAYHVADKLLEARNQGQASAGQHDIPESLSDLGPG